MVRVVFGSTNPSKLERMRALFARIDIEIIDGTSMTVPDIDEGGSIEQNAAVKATSYARATGQPSIATDYGLRIAGLAESEQPDAYVRRVRRGGQAATDDVLLAHYRERIRELGGSGDGTWTAAIAVAFDGEEVVSQTASLTRRWIDTPSDVVRPGEPLASLQIDPDTGKYLSELDVEDRASQPNPIDEAFLRFVSSHLDRLRSRSTERGKSTVD